MTFDGMLSPVSERLAKFAGRDLVISFWVALLVATLASAVPPPYRVPVGALAHLAVAAVWFGYPLAVFHCFAPAPVRWVGVIVVVVGVASAFPLVMVSESSPNEPLWSVIIFALIWLPFAAAAYALRRGERHSFGKPRTNPVVAAFAFFALPILGGFVHSRVKAALGDDVELKK